MKKMPRSAGFTLVEVVLAMVVFSLISLSVAQAIFFFSTQGSRTREKGFATQKAIQMLEELRSAVTQSGSVAILDNYNDGINNNYVLTTNLAVSSPADPSSGNGNMQLYRRVTVAPMPNDGSARQVYVRVYDANSNSPLAQTMSVLRTVPNKFYPSQVFDVYFIAIDNVPGWWALTATLKPIVNAVTQNLQAINPGLVINEHWITQMGYGRDPYYTPWINSSSSGTIDTITIPSVYFYPGWTLNSGYFNSGNTAPATDQYYYNPTVMQGQLDEDGAAGSVPNLNTTLGFNYADEYNHAMRYPDELNAYNLSVSSAAAAGATAPQITLRMLLEELNQTSVPLQNILLMNLHGEMLPLPPMRNYSDAAKDPGSHPGQRIVTHPQWLQYASSSTFKLRVYSYVTPEFYAATPASAVISSATLYFPTAYIPSANISVRMATSTATNYSWITPAGAGDTCTCVSNICLPTSALDSYCVHNTGSAGNGTTEIVLMNSPLRHPELTNPNYYGLPASQLLYGMEYIPSPPQAMVSGQDFFEGIDDLTTNSNTAAKNTARWVIQVATSSLGSGQFQVQTRIGADLTTGPASLSSATWSNQSNTYVWIGSTPPYTEMYQFMGDPRYEPYADSKALNNYNWDFIDISTKTNGTTYAYQGYYDTVASAGGGCGWGSTAGNGPNCTNNGSYSAGTTSYDVPRLHQMYRKGLLNSGGLWTTMSGWSFYYAALGGDMGDDGTLGYKTSGGQAGIPMNSNPWSPHTNSVAYVNEIVNDSGYTDINARLPAWAANTWVANPWVGELYPDAAFGGPKGWNMTGNLPTASTSATSGYYRANHVTTFTMGGNSFQYPFNPDKRVNSNGATTFFNAYPLGGSVGASYFQQYGSANNSNAGDTSDITATGNTVAAAFNYTLLPTLYAARPWQINNTGGAPPQWSNPAYTSQYTQSSIIGVNYTDNQSGETSWDASGLIMIQDGTTMPGSHGAYMAVNGVGSQSSFGATDLTQLSLATMMYGYLQAGVHTNVTPVTTVGAIHQVPLISISTPAVTQQFINPTTITIGWNIAWTRWNGTAYTSSYSAGFSDPGITMDYNVKWSPNNGLTWEFLDGTPATFGVYSAAENVSSPVVWNVSGFPQATYLIDVEGFRNGFPLHYTYQEQSIYIQQ
jgi:prepilin-type N-terminal cleavage/methylation domain-containing protein